MHIPDGYLSPETAVTMYTASAPFWYLATKKVRLALTGRTVPLLAVFAAFAFVVQMFNIPLPGGTTGHAIGTTLIAVILGPWLAIIGMSITLVIQALIFGDGGILAIGANVFNMAIIPSFVGYNVFRLIAGSATGNSRRRVIAAALGSYLAINAGALLTAVELGLQPLLFHQADGTPTYAPYGLAQAIPAMMIGHLTVAGLAEGFITALVVSYLQRVDRPLLEPTAPPGASLGRLRYLWLLLAVPVLLLPLGLLAEGTAWGEWGLDQLAEMGLGFIPQGLAQFSGLWKAPVPDYEIAGIGGSLAYILSGILGMAAVAITGVFIGRLLSRKDRINGSTAQAPPANLQVNGFDLVPVGTPGKKRSKGFAEKGLLNIAGALEQSLYSERTARLGGFLQRLDPRSKLLGMLALLIAASFSRNLFVLLGFYLLALGLAIASRIPLRLFVLRVWLLMPLFTGVIAFPAIFNFVTPGKVLIPLVDLGSPLSIGFFYLPQEIGITSQGLMGATVLILRVASSVSLAVLLTLTTPWSRLMKALNVLRIPTPIIFVLSMTHRYIFLLLRLVDAMFMSLESRRVGKMNSAEARRWTAASVGALVEKSYELSNSVYLAMLSRGFQGNTAIIDGLQTRTIDWLWLLFTFAVAAFAILLGRLAFQS